MNYLNELLPENLLYALGWTVVHSLWQGVLIALILAVALIVLQKKSAKARYLVANLGLLAVLITSIVTFCLLTTESTTLGLHEAMAIEVHATVGEPGFWESITHNFTIYFNQNLPLIVSVWLMGMVFFLLKMVGGLLYIQHLKNRNNYPLGAYWQEKMNTLAAQIPLQRSVALLESAMVKVPMVIGYFKPIIFMPIGAVNGLSEEQVEAILAHELAHIARNDYLLNILQSFVETLFYYHPAVWWISGNIRLERENCCDDLAVELCGNSLSYAKALVSLQEMHAGAPSLAMAFSSNKNHLLHRVQRILNQPQSKFNIMEKLSATMLLLLMMIAISLGANTPLGDHLSHMIDGKKIRIEIEKLSDFDVIEQGDKQTIIARIIEVDTIPKSRKKNRETYIRTKNGEKTEFIIVDGDIQKLVIDGKKIPKEEYGAYENEIAVLRESLEHPSLPPAPPLPPESPEPPAPPAAPEPPTPGLIAPSAPEAPTPTLFEKNDFQSFWFSPDSKKIITEKVEDGKTMIVVEEQIGDTPVEIVIEDLEDGRRVIVIDGEPIEVLEENDRVVIEEYEQKRPNKFFFDLENEYLFELHSNKEGKDWPELLALEEARKLETDVRRLDLRLKGLEKGEIYRLEGLDQLFLNKDHPGFSEQQLWREQFQAEMNERRKDGNLSKDWMNKKKEEWEKQFPEKPFVTPHLFEFDFALPKLESEEQRNIFPQNRLYFEELQNRQWMDELERELRLDGLIEKGKLYKLELNDQFFKINGQQQSEKYLKKYRKLLKKQRKQRLKLKSKLS